MESLALVELVSLEIVSKYEFFASFYSFSKSSLLRSMKITNNMNESFQTSLGLILHMLLSNIVVVLEKIGVQFVLYIVCDQLVSVYDCTSFLSLRVCTLKTEIMCSFIPL